MDGVHILHKTCRCQSSAVLILVVMDGVHIQQLPAGCRPNQCRLNPCCNGWCTHTYRAVFYTRGRMVLILVVMDGVHIPHRGWRNHL